MGANWRRLAAGVLAVFPVLAGLGVGGFATAAQAKEVALMAIELYDGPSGAAYVQLSDLLISGKAEMRDCSPFQQAAVDKSTYGKMDKVALGPGGILERGADGVMHYTAGPGSAPVCVVPLNVKFEHNASLSLSDLADLALLRATPVGSEAGLPTVAPPIKRGVMLVFLAAPNQELAEYLRAQRASDIPGWQAYISKYQGSPHVSSAKLALAALFVEAGEASLKAYEKTAGGASPAYADLKTAKAQSDQAHVLAPDLASSKRLTAAIQRGLGAIVEKGRTELDAYHAALTAKSAGYIHLLNARGFCEILGGLDAYFPPGQALLGDATQDSNAFEAALRSAKAAVDGKQYDQGYTFILPYRAFAEEETRVAAIVDAVYDFHLAQGNKLGLSENWQSSIREFEKAAATKDTGEARDLLANAHKQLILAQDKDAAAKALESSQVYQQQHNMIQAYEVLSSLTAPQQAIVADTMKQIEPAYVVSAAQEAKNLHQAHTPIRGLNDEVWMEKAYVYLERAFQLSENESYRDKMDLDGDELSAYLLDQAKIYLGKPGGSGTELGYAYLEKARQYKASNLDAVRDAIVAATAAHAMRSKLSIRVQFRDQTSQRDNAGFAGQLENAIITGLEDSGIPVKVVRVGEATAVDPDFELDGDVLTHHLSTSTTREPLESTFRAGTEQVPNDAWKTADRTCEKAKNELANAQAALQGAEAKGNRKEVEEQHDAVTAATKSVEDAEALRDSIPQTKTQDIVRPYTYTRRTIEIGGLIELQFRIDDTASGQRGAAEKIQKEKHAKDVLLEDVKSEDLGGVKSAGTATDPAEFMTQLENVARDELIAAVRKRVDELPRKMYEIANGRETENDPVPAGEFYLRFLEIAPVDKSPERQHARQFLIEQFNMRAHEGGNP